MSKSEAISKLMPKKIFKLLAIIVAVVFVGGFSLYYFVLVLPYKCETEYADTIQQSINAENAKFNPLYDGVTRDDEIVYSNLHEIFYSPKHKACFSVIRKIYQKNKETGIRYRVLDIQLGVYADTYRSFTVELNGEKNKSQQDAFETYIQELKGKK